MHQGRGDHRSSAVAHETGAVEPWDRAPISGWQRSGGRFQARGWPGAHHHTSPGGRGTLLGPSVPSAALELTAQDSPAGTCAQTMHSRPRAHDRARERGPESSPRAATSALNTRWGALTCAGSESATHAARRGTEAHRGRAHADDPEDCLRAAMPHRPREEGCRHLRPRQGLSEAAGTHTPRTPAAPARRGAGGTGAGRRGGGACESAPSPGPRALAVL